MRYLLLTIALLCFALSLSAQETINSAEKYPLPNAPDEIFISPVEYHVLNATDFDLNLTISNKMGAIYVNLSFEVDQQQSGAPDYYSLFLNKNAVIERIRINGKDIQYYITTNLQPLHFVPEFSRLELLAEDAPVTCYSFDPQLFEQDNTTVFMEYWYPMPDWESTEDGSESFSLGDIPFLYPRNIYNPAEVSVHMLTSFFCSVEDADDVDIHGDLRRYHKSFVDMPHQAIQCNLKKVLN